MFGGVSVFHSDGHDFCLGTNVVEVPVVGYGEGRFEEESTSTIVHQDRELLVMVVIKFWNENTSRYGGFH